MKTIAKFKLYFLIGLLHIFLAGCSTSSSNEDSVDSDIDTDSPTLLEVTSVKTPNNGYNIEYTFSSSEEGTISYGGSCSSGTTSAVIGNNTITFPNFDNKTYTDCKIIVTDSAGNESTLEISDFTVSQSSLIGGSIQGAELIFPIVNTIQTPIVTTLAGTGDNGSVNGTGILASFNDPEGIATDGTNLYVTDNHSIRKIVISTGVVTTLAGSGDNGSQDGTGTSASFFSPKGITCDGTNLYVVDSGNNNIRKIVIDNGTVTTIAGTGSTGSSDNSIGTSASFNNPCGITCDGTNLYVTDKGNHKIRRVVIDNGTVTTIAGTGSSGSSNNSTGTSASFDEPEGITSDGTNLYVVDTENELIRKIVIDNGTVTTLAGDADKSGSDDGIGTSAEFNNPRGITSDGTNLYVADTSNNTIRKIVIDNGTVTTFSASFNSPFGIISDGTNLYLVNKGDSSIRKIQ